MIKLIVVSKKSYKPVDGCSDFLSSLNFNIPQCRIIIYIYKFIKFIVLGSYDPTK